MSKKDIKKDESLFVKIKRFFNKNEWSVRLLNLKPSEVSRNKPGLIMIQIDGFSHNQLKKALDQGEMPFLKRLIFQQNYQLYSHYPGLPTATPSVQAELFYGVKQPLPAFAYYDEKASDVAVMYKGEDASRLQRWLETQNEGLLKGGTSYSNVFSGGADEYHYCAVNLQWFNVLKNARLLRQMLFFLVHILEILSIGVLMVWEILISFVDLIKGMRFDKNFLKELKFIPTRALFCILLREMIVIGIKMDIARGFPVIHANFIGYDEQSHRRGPSSRFAHWTLKGIDGAIERIYREALNSSRRHYDVWLYSDHGQEDTRSYYIEKGQSVQRAVEKVFKSLEPEFFNASAESITGVRYQRLRYFNNRFLNKKMLKVPGFRKPATPPKWVVTAIGPTGNIYAPVPLTFEQKCTFARKLVAEARIPLIAVNEMKAGQVWMFSDEGEYRYPQDAVKIFGTEHPFLEDVTRDFLSLTQHPFAGEFTICGWFHGKLPYTFAVENGSHAGAGYEETHAFALLPLDVMALPDDRAYIRTADLRQAAINYLNQNTDDLDKIIAATPVKETCVRLMTYNVHSCIGLDGHISPERIARVIARHEPDIVALQELDMNRKRTEQSDQTHIIAEYLKMHYHFHANIRVGEEHYGNAILSRYPLDVVFAGKLPIYNERFSELRGAIWVKIIIDGQEWQIINTHFGLGRQERMAQARALVGLQWLKHPECRRPVVVCGDFNSLPGSPVNDLFETVLKDASCGEKTPTWMSRCLIKQLDHIFASPDIQTMKIWVPRTDLDKVASDHLPLIADLKLG